MKTLQRLSASLLLVVIPALSTAASDKAPLLATDKDKTSYAIGVQTARSFKHDGTDVDIDLVIQGLRDGLKDDKPLLSDREIKQRMQLLMTTVRQKMVANRQEAALKNKIKSEEFLAANGKKEGIEQLENGIQYRVIKRGAGRKPVDTDTVMCKYRGALIDGTEFDASPENKAVPIKLSQAVAGLREAVVQMPLGSTWQIFVPAKLAYGERGVGSEIGPNELLIFNVELLDVL